VIVAGFFAAQGLLDIVDLILLVAIGAVIGDSIGYEMGSRLGRSALEHHGNRFGLRKERIERAEAFFNRHGSKAVLLGRFVGFARALVPFLAGSLRMPYRKFLPYTVEGAALWSPATLLVGYALGEGWKAAEAVDRTRQRHRWRGCCSSRSGWAVAVGGAPRSRNQGGTGRAFLAKPARRCAPPPLRSANCICPGAPSPEGYLDCV
jgi:membrane protein YqaA with SNARE-associated domain